MSTLIISVYLDIFSFHGLYLIPIRSSLAVFTWFYTSLAGLPASIVTDKFQAYLMAGLVFILLVVACANPNNRLTKEEFDVASNWTTDGLVAAVTLTIAIACGEYSKGMLRYNSLFVTHAYNNKPQLKCSTNPLGNVSGLPSPSKI